MRLSLDDAFLNKSHDLNARYWNIYPERHGVVWIALERVSAHNGTVTVLPGFHKRGCLPRFHDDDRAGFNRNIRAYAPTPLLLP